MSTENLSSFAYFKAYQGSLPTPRLPEVYVHKIVSDLVLSFKTERLRND